MAHYIKYEIFLPVEYIDKQTGEKRYLEYSSLRQLSSEVVEKYGGYTETNPTMAPLYRGYYASGGEIEVDLLITSMVLVPASQFEESLIYFTQCSSIRSVVSK